VLAPGTETAMVFVPDSVAHEGPHEARAYTVFDADMNPGNDTACRDFVCLRHDVCTRAVISPPSQVIVLRSVPCSSVVYNPGGFPETFLAMFAIWTATEDAIVYLDSEQVELAPGDSARIGMPHDWIVPNTPNVYFECRACTRLPADQVHPNDTAKSRVQSIVLQHDVGVVRIVAPQRNVLRGDTVIPRAVVQDFGPVRETFRVFLRIGRSWSDSTCDTLDAGRSDTVPFSFWVAESAGTFAMKCSTVLAGDQDPSNDTLGSSVRV
jgi:hypothetical protein